MRKKISYQDFVLSISRTGNRYSAKVLDSPAGQAAVDFDLPFTEQELEELLAKVATPRRMIRQPDSPEMQVAKTFGKRLFEAVFAKEVGMALRRSLDAIKQQEEGGLRLKLRLAEGHDLQDIPWEYLYPPFLHQFLCLSQRTPIVRYLELTEPVRPLVVKPPLRILAVIAKPQDLPQLDVEKEWQKLNEALTELRNCRLVILERLDKATLVNLQRRFRKDDYHILHFIGHGVFDDQTQKGMLLMEDEAEHRYPVDGEHFGTLLSQCPSLRLVILNACEGARTSRVDPFAGMAQSLVQHQIPAVIAMQFEMTDEAAIAFTEDFYGALAEDYLVEAALAEARLAILAKGKNVEWGTPALYMRSPEGRIFDFVADKGTPSEITDDNPKPTSEAEVRRDHDAEGEPTPKKVPINPFYRGRPVKPNEFIGRASDLRQVLNRVANGESIAIIGQPDIGKTSLLKKILHEKMSQTKFGGWFDQDLFCYLHAHTIHGVNTVGSFWQRALAPLEECLQTGQPAQLQILSEAFRSAKTSHFASHQLDQLFAGMSTAGVRLVLMLDDFDLLLTHPVLHNAEFYGKLRELATTSSGLVLVIATRLAVSQLHEQMKHITYGSPYFNNILERNLGAFTPKEISELLDRAGDHFNPKDRDFVAAVSGGHPYLAQVAAATLWEIHNDDQQGIARYRAAASELYREAERHFVDTWRLCKNEFRIALATVALAQIPRLLAQSNLLEIGLLDDMANYAPELAMLEAIGFVNHLDGEGWSITQGAFLWWLVDELRRTIRDETDFNKWLKKQEMADRLTSQEQETIRSAVKKVLAALDRGAMTLIEAFTKKLGEETHHESTDGGA